MKQVLTAPATLQQIATAYGVSTTTFRKWLKIAGIYKPHNKGTNLYTAKEINKIIDTIGPTQIYIEQ